MRRLASVGLIVIGIGATSASMASMSCIEVGQFVEGVAEARDRGQAKSRLIEITQEDGSFTAGEKQTLKQYIDLVYRNADIPPAALSNMAIDTCYRPNARNN